jgi:electron transport complex protein RnfD
MSNLTVSASPHIRDRATTNRIMLDVVIALAPAFIASILIFGTRAALIVLVCVASCVISEWIFEKGIKKASTVRDLSAVVTGILLAYNLPVGIPIWQAIFGSAVAIILVKQLFGGIGKNFANPAITARIVMFLAFSISMTTWTIPGTGAADAVSGATPLVLIAKGNLESLPSLTNMLLGVRGGCLGETSVIALVLGGLYLIARRIITWHTPVVYIATVFAFTALLGQQPVYQVLSGGLVLGAIFMATDYVTTPQTNWGRVIFGLGAGFLTVIIRVYGSYPEGVSYSILLMNIVTPYINRLTMHKAFGGVKA